ncbi:hypothetical protein RN001_006054 [Aquatica leii]|uniref:Neurite outgrowth-associated protein n=1 Tax=Aquatica leii TaxID=1421715 RepID=A0AAN7SS65_9COLE|nr:hypothetical protein RN001_006054 [Aquatica leii]
MYFIARRLFTNNNLKAVKEIQRNFARRRLMLNPGIDKRKNLMENDIIDLEEYDFDLESDFMNVGTSYYDHIKEIQHQKEKEQHLIVKQKYFKEKSPNFLSWADKEQILYLNQTDPEEWTIEKLSEGFPALPEVIAKILKATWTKKSERKIQNHDNSVKENWRLFKENQLTDLNPRLVEHLKKFSNRTFENAKQMKTVLPTTSEKPISNHRLRVGNEFSNIITSYERLKNKNVDDTKQNRNKSYKKNDSPTKNDTYVVGGPQSSFSKHITLHALEDKIHKKSLQGMALSDDEVLLRQPQQPSEVTIKKPIDKIIPPEIYKSSTTKLTSVIKRKEDSYLLEYPEKITIPNEKLKRGATYKLNDCFYDDDGLFLYRVPGMYK